MKALLFLSVGLAASALTYNAALNQPAFTVIQFNLVAGLANDGSFATTDPNCAFTYLPVSPWWAVDLGDTFTVVEVKLTAHSSFCTYR